MKLSIISKNTLAQICMFLDPMIDSVKIRGNNKIIYIQKLGLFRRRRTKKYISEVLFIDIPNLLAQHNYANSNMINYYMHEVKEILNTRFLTKQNKIEKIIYYYYEQTVKSNIKDTINDISVIKFLPRYTTRSSIKISDNIRRNKEKKIKINRIFQSETNNIKVINITEDKKERNIEDIFIEFTKKNINSIRRTAVVVGFLLSLSLSRIIYSFMSVPILDNIRNLPLTNLIYREPVKIWYFVT